MHRECPRAALSPMVPVAHSVVHTLVSFCFAEQVVRCALENAASVARTFLMSDVVSSRARLTAAALPTSALP